MFASRLLALGLVLGIWLASDSVAGDNKGASKGPSANPNAKKNSKPSPPPPPPVLSKTLTKDVAAARDKGLIWLMKNQAADGSWGKSYTVGVTSIGCLAFLSASDEPFDGDRGKAMTKGLQFLLDAQKDGMFLTQGVSVRTWIHNQGFASLALSEAYGRSLFCKVKPDIDVKKLRAVVAASVQAIAKNQSESGGWWYTPGELKRDEGATTVCAVQALVSAENFGIEIDSKVIDKGFEYLKKSQNKDGSFNYIQGDNTSMRGGTAADVATLGLMQKFDFDVMMKGYKFLLDFTPAGMSAPHQPYFFPYYGHYYGSMGMHLLGQEYKDDKTFRANTGRYIAETQQELVNWQEKDGGWQNRGWIADHEKTENSAYATTFATLTLYVPEARLSIYNRTPPKLPKGDKN
jgi:Prenyltransferase and squalene oxidase repeat